VTDLIRSYAQGGNGRGRGGMESKLAAVEIVSGAQRLAVIANGRTPGVLDMICAGQPVGTLFRPGAGLGETAKTSSGKNL
jgi:glutamate 5-kinase